MSSPLSATHLIVCKLGRGAGHGTPWLRHRHKSPDIRTLPENDAWQRLIHAEPYNIFGQHQFGIGVARLQFPIAAPAIITKSP